MKRLFSMMMAFVLSAFTLISIIIPAYGEHEPWDCPDCDRTGNKGNYCGECGHPSPWIDPDAWKANGVTDEEKLAAFRIVGGYVTFGSYEQDNNTANGQEPIEWLVLDYDAANNRALLLSRYGLDEQPYNKELTSITWEECTLRTWLNGTFLDKAFTAQEQTVILLTNVDNSSSQGYSKWILSRGNNTQDKIFLLSYAEANKYLGVTYDNISNMKARVSPTCYASEQGVRTYSSNKTADGIAAGWWCLRSPGINQTCTAIVIYDGSLYYYDVSHDSGCVRPALWINLESDVCSTILTSTASSEPDVSIVEVAHSGSCGNGLTWSYRGGELRISGTGAIENYKPHGETPWKAYKEQIQSVAVCEGITAVGEGTFYNLPALTNVSLPSTVTEIGTYAFGLCFKLASIVLPSGLQSIGLCAFDGCESLSNIAMPASTRWIAESAFDRCTDLQTIAVDPLNPSYCSIDGVLYDKAGTTLKIYPAGRKGAFSIPAGVTNIGNHAFSNRDYLTEVIISETVSSIGDYAFSECEALSSVTLSSGLQSIGRFAFAYCNKLLSVELSDGLLSIENEAFEGCKNLTSVYIPASVTFMGNGVFATGTGRKRTTKITLIGYKGSLAEEYAQGHNYQFVFKEND